MGFEKRVRFYANFGIYPWGFQFKEAFLKGLDFLKEHQEQKIPYVSGPQKREVSYYDLMLLRITNGIGDIVKTGVLLHKLCPNKVSLKRRYKPVLPGSFGASEWVIADPQMELLNQALICVSDLLACHSLPKEKRPKDDPYFNSFSMEELTFLNGVLQTLLLNCIEIKQSLFSKKENAVVPIMSSCSSL